MTAADSCIEWLSQTHYINQQLPYALETFPLGCIIHLVYWVWMLAACEGQADREYKCGQVFIVEAVNHNPAASVRTIRAADARLCEATLVIISQHIHFLHTDSQNRTFLPTTHLSAFIIHQEAVLEVKQVEFLHKYRCIGSKILLEL